MGWLWIVAGVCGVEPGLVAPLLGCLAWPVDGNMGW